MAERRTPSAGRDIIPLHPDGAPARPSATLAAGVAAALHRVRLPAGLACVLRARARASLSFLEPALLLAGGAAALALLAGSIASALGVQGIDVAAVAATAGGWTLLATAGTAITRRGLGLARARWR